MALLEEWTGCLVWPLLLLVAAAPLRAFRRHIPDDAAPEPPVRGGRVARGASALPHRRAAAQQPRAAARDQPAGLQRAQLAKPAGEPGVHHLNATRFWVRFFFHNFPIAQKYWPSFSCESDLAMICVCCACTGFHVYYHITRDAIGDTGRQRDRKGLMYTKIERVLKQNISCKKYGLKFAQHLYVRPYKVALEFEA